MHGVSMKQVEGEPLSVRAILGVNGLAHVASTRVDARSILAVAVSDEALLARTRDVHRVICLSSAMGELTSTPLNRSVGQGVNVTRLRTIAVHSAIPKEQHPVLHP